MTPIRTQQEMAEEVRTALRGTTGAVVNTDSDGLLSAAVLSRWRLALDEPPLPIVGMYDNERLWLAEGLDPTIDTLQRLLWVDADVRLAGATVISQHVVEHPDVPGLQEPPDGVTLINPNYLATRDPVTYRQKYPFSTLAWVWALAAPDLDLPPVTMGGVERTGLLWAQDGGHESVHQRGFRDNCLRWALDWIVDMPLRSLAQWLRDVDPDGGTPEVWESRARRDAVPIGMAAQAERSVLGTMSRRLRAKPGEIPGWTSQQFVVSARQRPPLHDPASPGGHDVIVAFLQAATRVLRIPAPPVELMDTVVHGEWRSWKHGDGDRPPDWPTAFSLARTYTDEIAYTLLGLAA